MPTRSPTQAAVLAKWREGLLRDTRVAFPAQVVRYDATSQLCDVKPLLKDRFQDEDDGWTDIGLPVIVNVPVCWPRGGGYVVTMPLAAGDVVEILIQDRSIDAWLERGGEQAPEDERRHHLSDAVAIPGLHDKTHPVPGVPTDGARFGKEGGLGVKVTSSHVEVGGADDFAAKAASVLTELQAIVTRFNAHVHSGGTIAGSTGVPSVLASTPSSVASSTAKVGA